MDKIQIDTDTSHVENIQIGRLHAVRESTAVALIYIFRDDNTCVLLSDYTKQVTNNLKKH